MMRPEDSVSLRKEAFLGMILCLSDSAGKPPGGPAAALGFFEQLNPEAYEVIVRYNPSDIKVACLLLPASGEELVGEALNRTIEEFPDSAVMVQYATAIWPGIGKHVSVLCSAFESQEKAIVLLEEGSSFQLE